MTLLRPLAIVVAILPSASLAEEKGTYIATSATVSEAAVAGGQLFGGAGFATGLDFKPEITTRLNPNLKWQMRKRSDALHGRLLLDEKKQLMCGAPFDCQDFKMDKNNKVQCTRCPEFGSDANGNPRCKVPEIAVQLESGDLQTKTARKARVNLHALADAMKVDVCKIASYQGNDWWGMSDQKTLVVNRSFTAKVIGFNTALPTCTMGPYKERAGCTQIFLSLGGMECWRNGTRVNWRSFPKGMTIISEKELLSLAAVHFGTQTPTIEQTINPESCDELSGAVKFTDPSRFFAAVDTGANPLKAARTASTQR